MALSLLGVGKAFTRFGNVKNHDQIIQKCGREQKIIKITILKIMTQIIKII